MTKVLNSKATQFARTLRATSTVISVAILGACGSLATKPVNPMLGHWQNNTQSNLVGLRILSSTDCELYIERAFKPRSTRACKYEPYQDVQLLFLVGDDGECGTTADYEFRFDPVTPKIDLLIGPQPIVMYKQDSP